MSFPTISRSELSQFENVSFARNVSIGEDVRIGPGSSISAGVCLYPGTSLGVGVQVLENTVIGRPTLRPAANRTVKRIMPDVVSGTYIGDYSVIGASCVLYRGSNFGERTIICDLTSVREH